jgi:hypothetical protein
LSEGGGPENGVGENPPRGANPDPLRHFLSLMFDPVLMIRLTRILNPQAPGLIDIFGRS